MRGVPHVRSAKANPVSGTLLVTFDDDADLTALLAGIRSQLEALERSEEWGLRRYRPPLSRVLGLGVSGLKEAGPSLLLTAGAHSLNMLQGFSFIVSVNVAGGDTLVFLRKLGVESVESQLKAVTAASIALTFGEVWAQHARNKSWRRLARTTEHRLRTTMFTHIEGQDLAFFDQYGTGQLLNLLTGQVDNIGALVEKADGLFESCITVIVAGTTLLKASPGLALIAASALPLVALPARVLGRRAEVLFSKRVEPTATLNQALENILGGMVEVKSFTAEDQETERVTRLSEQVVDASVDASSAALLQSTVVQNLLYLSAALAIGHGAGRVVAGRMPHAQLIRAVYWIPLMMRAFGFTVHSSNTYYGATAAAQRLSKVLDSTPRIRSGPVRLEPGAVRGEIEFQNVTFAYDPARPVLRDVSFRVPAGTSLGIVGPNGSGKSTMLRLLLRFYEPDAGRILLDGHDLRDLDLRDLRTAVALVNQDIYLFEGTIGHNVRYGRPRATDEEVARALQADGVDLAGLGAADLDVRVGERGQRLSGGQRQRVALARALVKDAPVLVLDEATSQLDAQTEAAMRERLRRATSGRTLLLVAHRLGTIRDAGKIVVLDGGTIVEEGTHASLVERGGLYSHLWGLQV